MLGAGAAAGLEVYLPGATGQTIQCRTKGIQGKLRVRGRQDLLECEEVRVHPGHGTGQPRDVRGLVRTRAVRGTAAGKPADIPGAHTEDGGIGGDHAAAAGYDLLAPLGRGPHQALGGCLWGRGAGDRTPHVARRDPSGPRVCQTELEPAAASGEVNDGGHGSAWDSLKCLAAAGGVVEWDA